MFIPSYAIQTTCGLGFARQDIRKMEQEAFELMDVISDVLVHIPVKGCSIGALEFSGDWSFEIPECDAAVFYIVSLGSAAVICGDKPTSLSEGDVVILTRGSSHRLARHPKGPGLTLKDSAEDPQFAVTNRGLDRDDSKPDGSQHKTSIIHGRFKFGRTAGTHLKGKFPDVVTLRKQNDATAGWLDPLMRILAEEAESESPGVEAALNGLLGVLFVQTIRTWINDAPRGTLGWLDALRDPKIGKAIQLVHELPGEDWAVHKLASEVGMSRSNFAARFAQLTGEPPLRYLTRWRMVLAAHALETEPHRSINDIALSVGYDSETSFSVAFKRQFGKPPGGWRKDHMSARAFDVPPLGGPI